MPWRRDRLPTPVFWPREFHGLYSPWCRKESDTTERPSLSLTDNRNFLNSAGSGSGSLQLHSWVVPTERVGDALRDSPTLTDAPVKPAVTCTHLALQVYGKGKSQFYEDSN